HHDPAECWVTDLGEAGGGEYAAAADMELSPRDLLPGLRDHRVALEGTGAPLPREVEGRARERIADALAPETRPGDETGQSPGAGVSNVFGSPRPRDAGAQQAHVGDAGLKCAPPGGFAVEVGHQATRRAGLRVPAVGLPAKPVSAFLDGNRPPLH